MNEVRKLRSAPDMIQEVLQTIPPEFVNYYRNLMTLKYEDQPDYPGL
jgi:hypothetical protein